MTSLRSRIAWGGGLLLLLLVAWMLRGGLGRTAASPRPSSPPSTSPAPFHPPSKAVEPTPGPGTSDPKAAQDPPKAPVVLVVGRLVEPGGFAPIPALLHATQIVPIGAALKPVVPGDDGGFSFYWPRPGQPVAFEVRTAFHAILGSRTVVDEAAKRRVDLPAAAEGATLDAGAVPLPAAEKLSWVEGAVQSASGAPLEGLAVELVGREEFDGLRLRAVDRAPALGHAPNVPARYAADARFLLRHVRPGRYELSVSARGHRRKRMELEFPSAAPLAPLSLTLEACARAVSGRVVDAATGTPLAGARLRLSDGKRAIGGATTDASGAFKAWLEEDPAGPEIELAVSLEGYEEAVQNLSESRLALHREIPLTRGKR